MDTQRILFRCPNCGTEGKARAELLGRRVACKRCAHVFRTGAIDGATPAELSPNGTSASGMMMLTPDVDSAAHRRVASLEADLATLRDTHQSREAEHSSEILKATDRIADLERQIVTLQSDHRAQRGRDSEAHRDRTDALEVRLRQAEAAQEQIATLQTTVSTLKRDADIAQAAANEESRTLRINLAEAAAELERLAARAAEVDPLQAEIATLRARFDDLAGSQQATVVDLGATPFREVAELHEQLDQIREQLETTRRERDEALAELPRKEATLAELTSSRDAVEADLRADISRLERELIDTAQSVASEHQEAWHRDRHSLEVEMEQTRKTWREDHDRIVAEGETLIAELSAARNRADSLQEELESVRHQAESHRTEREAARSEASRATELQAEIARLQNDLESVRQQAETHRTERDAARSEADQIGELQALADRLQAERDAARSEADRAATIQADLDQLQREQEAARSEADRLREHLAEAAKQSDRIHHLEASLATAQADAARELESLRAELGRRSVSAPAATSEAAVTLPDADLDAIRKRDVEAAVKTAWIDFERRLSETQAKLKAANTRADLLEAEARHAAEQLTNFQRGVEEGNISSVDDLHASVTSFRIMTDRGGPRLTWAEAESRLTLTRQLAAERKDKALIDRINRVGDRVREDIEARNLTLADSLVRGMEIEVGLDPGGWSMAGLKIFRPSPSILASLNALAPAFDRVMRQGDRGAIVSTIREMSTVLGDQAGLPEIRRPGRVPTTRQPIAQAEAAQLFLDALEAENWLMRPILVNRPPPETALTTYACLVEACAEARAAVERHVPARLPLLDKVLQATAGMLTRRQQPDGHFPFLDPRGKASRFASVVEAMVARQPDTIKDGWVVGVDPTGAAQVETGVCGSALALAGAATGRTEWVSAALRAADWAAAQPNLPNFLANATSLRLIVQARQARSDNRDLAAIRSRLELGLLPGQAENGRWLDASSAQTPNHLTILRALHGAHATFSQEGHDALRDELIAAIDRAMGSLIQECAALGVPANGSAIRSLIAHRDLAAQAGPTRNPRIEAAILDSATVIQELCHDGVKPKLGVSPDLLATLVKV